MGIKKPAEIAEVVACSVGVAKCKLSATKAFILAIFAGVFIGFGAILATTVLTGTSAVTGLGIAKFMGGAVFSVGLMLVVICGAELFTGNNLIINSTLSKETSWAGLGKNWLIVYAGNFVGSILLAVVYFGTGLGNGAIGETAVSIASTKVDLTWLESFCRAILCNALVCLAVWMSVSATNTTGKIFSCFFPIMAFVASGFEHSIANMYFIPIGIFLAAAGVGSPSANLNWGGFVNNIIPVTIGNIVGGALFIGVLYWYVYSRNNNK
ncbi:MAG: formate/nitrite transporter family protein [Candidatus Lokiarchaeota archaeon]|nr:formate/nitrite transporter family protein [Candidatus Lokiarchaeota archaeon]